MPGIPQQIFQKIRNCWANLARLLCCGSWCEPARIPDGRLALPRRTRITLLLACAAIAAFSLGTGRPGEGAPIDELRSEVARIQAEVASIDAQVGLAAEAYNGAVYNLEQVNGRITENQRQLKRSNIRLRQTQSALAVRLRAAYIQPRPSRIQLLLTRTSTSELMSASAVLARAADQDRRIVTAVRDLRDQRIAARKQLIKDRAAAKSQVEERKRQQQVVTELLSRRQAVLSSAKGRLAQELEAERRREAARREIANRRAQAMMRARAASRDQANATRSGSGSSQNDPRSAAPSTSSPEPSTPAPSSSGGSSRNARAAQVAMQYLGVPYRWGGSSPSGFDCSGLAMYAYGQVGVSMAHYTGAIWSAFPRVQGDLQPGDLVFFSGLGHMGIYIGGGQMVHAPHTGDVVRVASINRSGYVGAVRP